MSHQIELSDILYGKSTVLMCSAASVKHLPKQLLVGIQCFADNIFAEYVVMQKEDIKLKTSILQEAVDMYNSL